MNCFAPCRGGPGPNMLGLLNSLFPGDVTRGFTTSEWWRGHHVETRSSLTLKRLIADRKSGVHTKAKSRGFLAGAHITGQKRQALAMRRPDVSSAEGEGGIINNPGLDWKELCPLSSTSRTILRGFLPRVNTA